MGGIKVYCGLAVCVVWGICFFIFTMPCYLSIGSSSASLLSTPNVNGYNELTWMYLIVLLIMPHNVAYYLLLYD